MEWSWQGNTEAIGEKPVRATLSTMEYKQTDLGMNPGLVDETPATNSLLHGTASLLTLCYGSTAPIGA